MPPNAYWYCAAGNFSLFAAVLCSTFLITSMTFDRFYSILKPHRAAVINTTKRAKITISCIVIFSMLYNVPHLFIGVNDGWQCIPYGADINKYLKEIYYWLSFSINFALPFLLILVMNSFIIHTICSRSMPKDPASQVGNREDRSKKPDVQILVILLLVTFGFLLLSIIAYTFFLCAMVIDFFKTPYAYAQYHLLYNVSQKLYYTNHGANFFFYVISGSKFRADLKAIFCSKERRTHLPSGNSGSLSTNLSASEK